MVVLLPSFDNNADNVACDELNELLLPNLICINLGRLLSSFKPVDVVIKLVVVDEIAPVAMDNGDEVDDINGSSVLKADVVIAFETNDNVPVALAIINDGPSTKF